MLLVEFKHVISKSIYNIIIKKTRLNYAYIILIYMVLSFFFFGNYHFFNIIVSRRIMMMIISVESHYTAIPRVTPRIWVIKMGPRVANILIQGLGFGTQNTCARSGPFYYYYTLSERHPELNFD